MTARLRFALDHNFPRTIIDLVMSLVPEADLVPLPVRATGLVLHKLSQLCGQHTPRRGQLWYLASGPVDPRDIRKDIDLVARRRRTTADKLIAEHKLSKRQLDSEALDQVGVGERS